MTIIAALLIISVMIALSDALLPAPRYLGQEPTWRILNKNKPRTSVLDVVSVLGRFSKREDFYRGVGYSRPSPEEGGILSKELFYDRISKRKFDVKQWPIDKRTGALAGTENLSQKEIEATKKYLTTSPASEAGAEAVFTALAKGAANGVCYPEQVDIEMARWLDEKKQFDLRVFEQTLLAGKVAVFVGWFLFIGLQFGAVYVIFFAPLMSRLFPDVDFYPVQTFLHTSEWGK